MTWVHFNRREEGEGGGGWREQTVQSRGGDCIRRSNASRSNRLRVSGSAAVSPRPEGGASTDVPSSSSSAGRDVDFSLNCLKIEIILRDLLEC